MNEIKIYLRPSGSLAYLYKDFDLYEGCYRNSQLTVFVPKSLLYENENGTFVNLVKTGAILTAPNGSKLTTKSYYLDYEREQTIGGVEFRVYTTITPKEFCVYAGTQTVVVNVESIDNTNADAQTIISVTTTQTADLIVLESAYLGQDEPIDPTELDKIKATLTEIQSEINEIPNNYVPRSSGRHIVYVNDINGNPSTQIYAVDASGNIIVQRDGNGQIKVPLAPAQDDDAVSKKYVDDADNTKLNKVEPFANGTYAYIVSKDDRFGTTNGYTEISETDKISTIVKRKTNGCIETRTPSADVEAANKGYVDTAISDTQGQLAQTNQNVEDLYTILEQAQVVTVTTLEQAYTTRETADGENIVDGVQTAVKEIRGKTVATTNQFSIANLANTDYLTVSGKTITVTNRYDCNSLKTLRQLCPDIHAGTYTASVNVSANTDLSNASGTIALYSSDGLLYLLPQHTAGQLKNVFTLSNADLDRPVYFFGMSKGTVTWDKLMVLEGDWTDKEIPAYSDWFAGLKNAFFKGITSTGRNLIPRNKGTQTIKGVTFEENADGTLNINGTTYNDSNADYYFLGGTAENDEAFTTETPLILSTNYIMATNNDLVGVRTSSGLIAISGSSVNQAEIPAGTRIYGIFARVGPGETVSQNNVYFMLNIGTSALPYEPYISDALFAETPIELAEYDVAYPETGETKRQSNTLTFDGTEEWYLTGNAENNFYNYRYYTPISVEAQKTKVPCICNKYDYNVSVENDTRNDIGILVIRGYVYIRLGSNSTIKNAAEWKAHLAELAAAGNPVTVTYKTAEATTESTPFNKSKYIAWKNGSETIEQGTEDNSEYGAEDTLKQDYFTLTGGTTNV